MKLPHAANATVDLRKLEEYCLNPEHPVGKHKARVFAATLGITRADAYELRERILEAAHSDPCHPGISDEYGDRYILDFTWNRSGRRARIRTLWIIRTGEDEPRLTSCYVL